MRALWIATLALLSACGSSGTEPDTAPAPDTASNFNRPLDARGNEPSWGLKVRAPQLTLSRVGQPDLVATATQSVIQSHQAAWTARTTDGRTMKVSLFASPCSDGMSDLSYSLSAEVDLTGETPLFGCAGPPAQGSGKSRP